MQMHTTYLAHYGIKGQRWGIRRYENEDGTLTEEGKRRYADDLKSAKKDYKNARKEYRLSDTEGDYINFKYAKRQYKDLKDSMSLYKSKKDEKQLKYEDEYVKKGMNKEDAELQAYRRRRTEKLLMATAGIAVTAIAATAAYKIYKHNVDRIIKKGTKFQHIVQDGNFRGVEDAFVSKGMLDKIKYSGVYGSTIKNRSAPGTKINSVTIEALDNVKIASPKNARKALDSAYRENPAEFIKFANKYFDETSPYEAPKLRKVYIKAKNDMRRGKITNAVYDAFNANYVGPAKEENAIKLFKSKLNSRGYGSIVDVNDYKYSGYYSKDPLILIDKNKKFAVNNIKSVSSKKMEFNKKIGAFDMNLKYNVGQLAPMIAVSSTAVSAANILGRKKDNELVAKYQKEHPGTEKTYNEILRDIYKR